MPSFWQSEGFRLLLSVNCKTELEFNLPSDYKCFLESLSPWFDIKIKSLSSVKMNLKISFQDSVAIFLYAEDCSLCYNVTVGVVVRSQPLSGKEVPQFVLLLDLRSSKELEARRCL